MSLSNNKIAMKLIAFLPAMLAGTALAASPLGCLIEPSQVAQVGSQVVGVTDNVQVERGDVVKKGQILATLQSDYERANVNMAKTRSELEADVRTAQTNLELARITEKRGVDLVQKKFLSQQALDKSHAETQLAEQRLTYAQEQLRISGSELNVAKVQLSMRSIRAPFDGIIAERYVWPGERVEEKPLFKIVKINPLRVEIVAPVELFGQVTTSQMIKVMPDLPHAKPIDAKVILVDKVIDGASNTFRVRAEINNPNSEVPSGLRCKAEILPATGDAVATLPTDAMQADRLNKPLAPMLKNNGINLNNGIDKKLSIVPSPSSTPAPVVIVPAPKMAEIKPVQPQEHMVTSEVPPANKPVAPKMPKPFTADDAMKTLNQMGLNGASATKSPVAYQPAGLDFSTAAMGTAVVRMYKQLTPMPMGVRSISHRDAHRTFPIRKVVLVTASAENVSAQPWVQDVAIKQEARSTQVNMPQSVQTQSPVVQSQLAQSTANRTSTWASNVVPEAAPPAYPTLKMDKFLLMKDASAAKSANGSEYYSF